jgi:hypothetical protein
MKIRLAVLACVGLCITVGGTASAYPGGTPGYVTDVAPYCASCHSSASADQLQGVPVQRVQAEQAANKHLAKIRAGKPDGPYAKLSEAQRAGLITGIEQIDTASKVEVVAPAELKAGQVFEVTVNATGGGGPVIGIALVDSNQRWQARPAPSAGWHVVDKPSVIGPDGQPQAKFTDGRNPALEAGTSYVNVYGVAADPGNTRFSSVSVTFRLRAPSAAGAYPLGAVFLYGTEKGSPGGAVETLQGKAPLGGFGGNSGRVKFSTVHQIQVR